MIKTDLKAFAKSIENINSTLQRIDELANTAIGQLIDLYEQSKKIHVITSDDIVPLSSIFPAERLLIKEDAAPLEPGPEQDNKTPKQSRKKAAEPAEPPATEPGPTTGDTIPEIVIVCAGGCGKTTEGMTIETKSGEFEQIDESGVPKWTCQECLDKLAQES